MLIEWLYNLKESIDKHGLRLGLILAILVGYRKELRNLRLDKRDEAYFHNQQKIMEQLGVGHEWRGQASQSDAELLNLKQWGPLFLMAVYRVAYLFRRRGRKMQKTVDYSVLILLIAGALKLILQPFGIDISAITDQDWNNIANGVASLTTIVGIFRENIQRLRTRKDVTQISKDYGPNSYQ